MTQRTNRRKFLKTTAALGVGYWVAGGTSPKPSLAANEEIRFGCIGVEGKGRSDAADAARHGKVVAICDIDEERLEKGAAIHPDAKKYFDYRKMLEEMDKSIDAVTVSTPDHTHAVAAIMAMKLGKGCYCQKPLTHSIWEAREMGRVARETGVATQMGNQGTALSTLRKSAALVQAGAVGTVKEVHVWTNRPANIWQQGIGRPTENPPVPSYIHWPEWISRAEMRPYHPVYHPKTWRGWWAFGTGALGDMACHTVNMPFMALALSDPVSVQATTTGHNRESYPNKSIIRFEFPANDKRPALSMMWYDGGNRPARELLPTPEQLGLDPQQWEKRLERGSLIVGDQGSLLSPGDYGGDDKNEGNNKQIGILYPDGSFVQQDAVKGFNSAQFERSPGHFTELAIAIKTGKPAMSNFLDYSVGLTETILLGNLAVWAAEKPGEGKKIEWDAQNLKVLNDDRDELAVIVRPEFHNGYSL